MKSNRFKVWDGIRISTSGIMFNTSKGCVEVPTQQSISDKPIANPWVLIEETGFICGGKSVFSGDIIELKDWGVGGGVIGTCVVEWDEDEVAYRVDHWRGIEDIYDLKRAIGCGRILGNIYENPELF